EQLYVFEECARGGGRGAVVNQQNVLIVDDDHVIAAHATGGVVHTLGYFFELVGFALGHRERAHREERRRSGLYLQSCAAALDVVLQARELLGNDGIDGRGP